MPFVGVISILASSLKIEGALLLLIAASGLLAGLILLSIDSVALASLIWTFATLPILATLLLQAFRSLRRGDFGLDILAALSMAFALLFGE